MSKLIKFVKNNGEFWRDFFIKKYPINYKNNIKPLPQEGGKLTNDSEAIVKYDPYQFKEKIDIVYTWVNYKDIKFQKKIKQYQKSTSEFDVARFLSHDELKFSLRSLEQFAPWVNAIYIVTQEQVPDWLDIKNKKLKIIFHEQIIEKQFLPTFNSHVIESCLHRIKGLSEKYIYMNDDVLFARPIKPSYFFKSNGLVNLFVTNSKVPNGPLDSSDTPTEIASKNSLKLLYQKTGYICNSFFAHTFHPQLKSTNVEIEKIFKNEINTMKKNKFRNLTDLNIPTFLSHHFNYIKAKGVFEKTTCMYFNIRSPEAPKYYQTLLARKGTLQAPYSMCVNDKTSLEKPLPNYHGLLDTFLKIYFNKKSSFEK